MQPFDTRKGAQIHTRCHPTETALPQMPGFPILFLTKAATLVAMARIPAHLCCAGTLIHSGVIIAMLEALMSRTALEFLTGGSCATQMSVDFTKPIRNTGPLKGESRVLSMSENRIAVVEGVLFNDRREVAARATSEWVPMAQHASL